MKRAMSVFMTIVLCLLLCCHVSAVSEVNDKDQTVCLTEEVIDFTEEYYDESEKKEICPATLADDFEDNTVIILISHINSMSFKNYTTEDFPEINLVSVQNLTSDRSVALQEEIMSLQKNKYEKLAKNIVDTNKASHVYDAESTSEKATRMAKTEVDARNPYFHQVYYLTLKVHDKQSVLDSIKLLEKREDVYAAEPNYYVKSTLCDAPNYPNDTYYSSQWAAVNMQLPMAWSITTGSSSVKVGVIDSGIKGNHTDLSGNISSSLSHSFKANSNALVDDKNHGTHVAGIIGAVGNNNKGVAGVNWNVTLASLKNDFNDGTINDTVAAINYAQQNNIEILNFSASTDCSSNYFKYAIRDYQGLFVCSAGNNGVNIDNNPSSTSFLYPSRFDLNNIISVAGINSNNQLHNASSDNKSNYGVTSVDIAAPGQHVYSTVKNGTYDYFSGTSMAAPQVSGVAALIKSIRPNICTLALRKAILDTATSVTYLSNKVATGGKINAYAAVNSVRNPSSYTLHYCKNGGAGATMPDSSITYGNTAQLSINNYIPPEGYKFVGWRAKNSSGLYAYVKPDGSLEWCAQGQQSSGSVIKVFKDGATDSDGISMLTENNNAQIYVYAQWELIQYHITFRGEGPQEVQIVTVTYNDNFTLPENMFPREEQMFNGWQVQKHGTDLYLYSDGNWYSDINPPANQNIIKKVYYEGDVISNLTNQDGEILNFRVQWLNLYSINYDSNGGSGYMDFTPAVSQTPIQLRPNTFVKQNYIFLGWYLQDNNCQWSTTYNNEWLSNIPNGYEIKLYDDCDTVIYDSYCDVTAFAQWGLLGDADLDESLTIMDATKIQRYLAGLDTFSTIQEKVADFDQDGDITIMDAFTIQIYLSNQ